MRSNGDRLPVRRLAGINVIGDPGQVGEAELALLASWRFSHVRLTLDAGLCDETNERAPAWRTLDALLERCRRARLACALALQCAQPELFGGIERCEQLGRRWAAVARRYAGHPVPRFYDLLDRPNAPDDVSPDLLRALGAPRPPLSAARRAPPPGVVGGRAWSALAVRLTEAVRRADADVSLIVESNAGASPAAFSTLRPTRDPGTLYSLHLFEPPAFALQGTPAAPAHPAGSVSYPGEIDGRRWDRDELERQLQPALKFRQAYDAALYVGAFGASAAAPRQSQLTWVRTVLTLLRRHGIGWAYWAYRDPAFGLVGRPANGAAGWSSTSLVSATPATQQVDYDLLGILQSEG